MGRGFESLLRYQTFMKEFNLTIWVTGFRVRPGLQRINAVSAAACSASRAVKSAAVIMAPLR